jgi:hypothetical protein
LDSSLKKHICRNLILDYTISEAIYFQTKISPRRKSFANQAAIQGFKNFPTKFNLLSSSPQGASHTTKESLGTATQDPPPGQFSHGPSKKFLPVRNFVRNLNFNIEVIMIMIMLGI